MANPYRVLNTTPAEGDEAIRQSYLAAVRRCPPERDPEEFKRIREAYERIKDEDSRLAFLLFEPTQGETIEELLEEGTMPDNDDTAEFEQPAEPAGEEEVEPPEAAEEEEMADSEQIFTWPSTDSLSRQTRPDRESLAAPFHETEENAESMPVEAEQVPLATPAWNEIESVLSAFRQWLIESERWRDELGAGLPPWQGEVGGGVAGAEDVVDVDLHTIVSEWIALRQEVRLEARGSKAARERLDQAADEFQEGVEHVQEGSRKQLEALIGERDRLREELHSKEESQERAWVELLLDIREGLERGAQAWRSAKGRLGWRARLVPAGLFGGLMEGYELGLRRIDAALESRGVRPIECLGQRVDPERMRVVDVARRADVPEGQVVELVRRGYVCGDRVIRYAEVRAAGRPQ